MPGVIAVLPAQANRSRESRMAKFAVGTLAARNHRKPGGLKLRNQLAYLSGHLFQF